MDFLAHTGNCNGEWQALALHLREVARLAEGFAKDSWVATAATGELQFFAEAARAAGLLHDVGKYQEGFQDYLRCMSKGLPHRKVPHAPTGAAKAISELGAIAHGFVPAGHHQGLPAPQVLRRYSNECRAIADTIWLVATDDCPELTDLRPLVLPDSIAKDPFRADVFLRLLFSCLVDADWCDTNAWKKGDYPYQDIHLPVLAGERLRTLEDFVRAKPKAGEINEIRKRVFDTCLTTAESPPGFFTLTVPTGGGKTLSSLAFALKHCAFHKPTSGPRRIIYVIPYLNILEQTANAFYEALSLTQGDGVILEHHSLAYSGRPSRDRQDVESSERDLETENPISRRMAENWEAPIILTTSVQFFESLFSNRPAAARKLHNIARSVVIFDECQTFPEGLYRPTLSMLRELVKHWGLTFVFCTATQPAILKSPAMRHGIPEAEIQEIMTRPPPSDLFQTMHRTGAGNMPPRVRVKWPSSKDDRIGWDELATRMREHKPRQALAIVNLKSHARKLFESLGGKPGSECPDDVFFLSTFMCAEHRRQILKEIKLRLNSDKNVDAHSRCYVASTQLVEAGVDFDFPAVFRAFGPLDAIGQAAGRCNRECALTDESGRLASGNVVVFRPETDSKSRREYPTAEYESGARVTEQMIREAVLAGMDGPDILNPKTYDRYFATLISQLDTDVKDIESLRRQLNFPQVAIDYQLIDSTAEQVVVPFSPDGKKENSPVRKRLAEARARGYVTLEMSRQLQPYLVNLWPHEFTKAQSMRLVLAVTEGWWEWIGRYDMRCGLMLDIDDLPVF